MHTHSMSQSPVQYGNGAAQQAPRQQLSVKSFGLTGSGRELESNEDQFLIANLTRALRVQQSSLPAAKPPYPDEQGHLFVVGDGMNTIEDLLLDALRWLAALRAPAEAEVLRQLRVALSRADPRLLEEVARHPEISGMGTTLTMAYSFAGELFLAHFGESCCHLLRNGVLHRLTHDHTVEQEMVRRGLLPPDRAADHALRPMLTNVIGGQWPSFQVDLHKLVSAPGDVLLLSSDILTEMLSDAVVAAILSAPAEPSYACARLATRAKERSGRDNVTLIVARYDLAD